MSKRLRFNDASILTQNIELKKGIRAEAIVTARIAVEGSMPYSGPIKGKLLFERAKVTAGSSRITNFRCMSNTSGMFA